MSVPRVVLDTNLLVSYLLTAGTTLSQIIDAWEAERVVVLTSPPVLDELIEVLDRPRLRQNLSRDPRVLVELLLTEAVITPGQLTVSGVCRDPKDDKFLACALEGGANYIVTGDADLLVLQTYHGARIVRPAEFVELLALDFPAES